MEQLEEIFFDPKQGYSNARELFQKAKKSGLKLNYGEVKKWFEAQPVNQIFRKPQKVRQYSRIRSHFHQTGEMRADLMDLMKFSRYNKGYKYFLNILDISSRFVWSFPFKTKKRKGK